MSITTKITFNDSPTGAGDSPQVTGRISSMVITNNTGESIAYSTNSGSSFTTLTNGSSATLGAGDPGSFRFRRVNSGGYPLAVDAVITMSTPMSEGWFDTNAGGSTSLVGAGGVVLPRSVGMVTGMHNQSGLKRFRAAMAAAIGEYGIARINCLGDSVTLGTYSNDSSIPVDSVADAQGYVGRLRTMFARRYGGTAGGYIAANDERNTLSGTGTVATSIGPIINTVRSNNTTTLGGALPLPTAATITIPLPACTTVEICYIDSNTNTAAGAMGANTGTFSYNIDAAGATTTTADNVNPVSYKKITVSGLSNATHELVLTGVSGTCYIMGVFYYGASGVVVSRFGLGGATCLDLTGEGVVTHLSAGATHRILGSLSYPAAPAVFTGSITSGSPVVTGISSTSGIVAGMPVGASAQLPVPCFVESVDSSTQITLTANATATNAARGMYIGAGTTVTADLWIIPIGHNDWQNQNHATYATPVSTFKTQIQRVIDTIVNAGGCVLLVGEPDSNNSAPTPETYADSDYWTALDELADANEHVASMHINKVWGTHTTAKTLGLLSDAGGVHPLKKGSADMARIIFDVLNDIPQS